MKYDVLYNFISPVTGKLADYSQFPILFEDYIVVGNQKDEAETSPILIDIRLNMMDMRHDIDSLRASNILDIPFIIQTPDIRVPNAQALSELDNGVLGNNEGIIEILQRVSGPILSTNNNVARFDGITGQVIKDSDVKIDDGGKVYAKSLSVTNLLGKNTGFSATTSMLSDVPYNLPRTGGFPTQMLTTMGLLGLDGKYQLYWSTPPSQLEKEDPDDPDAPSPVYIPIVVPAPIPSPYLVPIFVPGGSGAVIKSKVSIDPEKGDINTPGDIDAQDANFDGDVDIDGDLSTEGSINAEGSVSGDSFNFEDISDVSDDFVRMEAPFDLDHSYQVELADAEPIMQEAVQPPDQRILQTAWRRVRPEPISKTNLKAGKQSADNLPITKLSWTELEVANPITINFIPATPTTNEKMVIGYNGGGGQNIDIPYAVDLVYGTLNNINGIFKGFNSSDKDYLVKIKTSYYPVDNSSSAIGLFDRYDNGYVLKNENGNFKIQSSVNNTFVDIINYNKVSDSLSFNKPIEISDPTLPNQPATKEYVDSKIGTGGITSITAGTGLTGGTITTTGTIAIANTTVTAGSYRLGNFTVNAQGQLTAASNSSPTTTTVRAVPVWGNATGNSLLNSGVTIDTSNNISGSGASTFLAQQINNADGAGSLNFMSNGYSLQLRLSDSLTGNRLWFLPTNNANGFFKNNGSGFISWSTLSSSDIANFSTAVASQVTNKLGNITFSGEDINSTSGGINFISNNTYFQQLVQFVRGIHVGGSYVSFARTTPESVGVFPLGGSLFVDMYSRLCFKDKNGNVAIIVNPN